MKSSKFARFRAIPEAATQKAEALILLARALIIQSITFVLASGLLLVVSVFIYGSFYFAFVPAPVHQGPVHLVFEPCQEQMGKCGFLNASLTLSERNPILMTGQQYMLTLSLEMPESDVNRNLGMFMTCAQLKSAGQQLVRNACRSTMLRYKSESVRYLGLYFQWPFLLTGYSDEKQWIHVPLLEDFLDDPLHPATRLDFQVQSRYAEVYSAHYRIDAKFSGLRYIMFHYPATAAIFGSGLNMFILAGILILSWYRFFAQPLSPSEDMEEFKDPFDNLEESNLLGGSVETLVKKEGENKEDANEKKEEDFEDFGLPDFTSHKDL